MKKILSIDGGGIRGIIPARILVEIEKKTGKPTAECFDLMAGTSTGGILCLGLAKPDGSGGPQHTAKDLLRLYVDRGKDIFRRSFWRGVSSIGALADERYSHEPLEEILRETLEGASMGDAVKDVLISSYDIERRSPFFMKSWRPAMQDIPMWKAARATSAAPTYFEPARIEVGDETRYLVDGGVFVNNPAASAYAEAKRRFPGEDLLVVSLGSGELTRPIPYEDAKDWGKLQWLLPILGVVFDGVSDAVDYQMREILAGRFHRFQIRLDTANDDIDDASEGNIENLKTEAQSLLRARRAELEAVCRVLQE